MTTPVTTAGRLSVVRYSTTGAAFSAAVDISSSIDSETFDHVVDQMDVTTFGNTSHVRATTIMDTKFDLSGFYNPTLEAAMITAQQAHVPAVYGTITPVTFYYAPQGASTGLPLYAMTAWVTSVTADAKATDITAMKIGLIVTGDLVVSTQ